MNVSFDFEFEGFWVTGGATFSRDPDHGADADGNRGTPRVFIKHIHFAVFDEGVNVTSTVKKLKERMYWAIETEAMKRAGEQFRKEFCEN